MQHRFIDDLFAEYLKGQIGGGCPVRAKRALQDVCVQYARGLHFKSFICPEVEIATVGQLDASMLDRKVRRWCLNVLALIGTPDKSKDVIERVIERHHNDPDTMASALTAYFRVCQTAFQDLRGRSYLSAEQIALAAHVGDFGARIRKDQTTINIEKEGPSILRTALVAVGLNRAPENLFDPRFENAELVRQLSRHEDEGVAQYSVWAINEHPDLGVEHLGFDVTEVGGYAPNMRGWVYRLFGEAEIEDGIRHEVVAEGSKDVEPEARLNLARGLRQTWYDGLEEVTYPWFHDEAEADIREEIVDHMVRQSDQCSEYQHLSLELFETSDHGSAFAKRMLASSEKTPIYREFRRIKYLAEGDLFDAVDPTEYGGTTNVTNNTYNIGSVQGGAVSVGGVAKQNGNNKNTLTGNQTAQLSAELKNLAGELRALQNQTDEIKDVTALVEEAAENPEPSKLGKVRSALSSLFSGASSAAKFGGDITKITSTAQKVLEMLPPM